MQGTPITGYYEKKGGQIVCKLCPHHCIIAEGKVGLCKTRINQEGSFYSLVYGYPVAIHQDPIEKKPLYHYFPGSSILSLGTVGCNLYCKGCQNFDISRAEAKNTHAAYIAPESIVVQAKAEHIPMIAYTYTEPTIFFEYMLAIAKQARAQGIRNVMVSNGYIKEKPLQELLKYLDAVNIDLKGFDEKFYKEYCHAELFAVLKTLKRIIAYNKRQAKKRSENKSAAKHTVWLEITNLLIPGLNDDPQQIAEMCAWIKKNLGSDVPVHFSRFYPYYKATHILPTSMQELQHAKMIAQRAGLRYVYIGNTAQEEHTRCAHCGHVVIFRKGYAVDPLGLQDGRCTHCKKRLPGVFK